MSIAPYSAESAQAIQLVDGKFKLYYDKQKKQVIFDTGDEKISFNAVYTKEEVDNIISTGGDFNPTAFLKAILVPGAAIKISQIMGEKISDLFKTTEMTSETYDDLMKALERNAGRYNFGHYSQLRCSTARKK
ncbi:hypothetical protein TRFO_35578 [Tritrichomonas foetus]|uniref:Uncharacterized protein n=1 Tax=Tritrichomonas foetus TaxID=1144522 RepID=A0A1J4JFT3_9EUKA|nr:hypothetical protein TRFO_35578 [Tritrichomonas foetus]|eukprot:OHS98078.1 hypothetical protein TRFO_35578 [Tritrichomonas foetus]